MGGAALKHSDLSEREKIFYAGEAKFVEYSSLHNRGLATLSATELGFLITSLTLAGTNETARTIATANASYLFSFALLLIISLMAGSFQGYLMAKMALHGNRASFLGDNARVELSNMQTNFTKEQIDELLSIADKSSLKNKNKFKFYAYANFFLGLTAGLSFFAANALFMLGIFKYLN